MKTAPSLVFIAWICALLPSCATPDEHSVPAPKAAAASASLAVLLEKAKVKTEEANEAVEDYAFARKAEFVETTKRDLNSIRAGLDLLAAKIETTTGAAMDEARVTLSGGRDRLAVAEKQLAVVEVASEAAWVAAKSDFQRSRDDLRASVEAGRKWLSEKVAP